MKQRDASPDSQLTPSNFSDSFGDDVRADTSGLFGKALSSLHVYIYHGIHDLPGLSMGWTWFTPWAKGVPLLLFSERVSLLPKSFSSSKEFLFSQRVSLLQQRLSSLKEALFPQRDTLLRKRQAFRCLKLESLFLLLLSGLLYLD